MEKGNLQVGMRAIGCRFFIDQFLAEVSTITNADSRNDVFFSIKV